MPPKKKAANGYKFAEPLPKGTVLTDISKVKWKLGASIGKGGFGDIYEALEDSSQSKSYPYIVKIEPHANGPLFVETNFYIRYSRAVDVEAFKKDKGLTTLGIPLYYGSGSHEYKGEKYRFLVTDKFATDIYKLYIQNDKVFPVDTVFKIAIQLLDALEYVHSKGYVHADIKSANILLGSTKDTANKQVYLIDFGLASKFTTEESFKPNPKRAHDGTIEFLSRDAHQGVPTRRGDLEILAYNLIQWLGCALPWEKALTDPKTVHKSKEEHMTSAAKMIKACFGTNPRPKAIFSYLTYILSMDFNTDPDYKKIRSIFLSGVKEGGGTVGTPLIFSKSDMPASKTEKAPSARRKYDRENEDDTEPVSKLRTKRNRRLSPEENDEATPETEKEEKPVNNGAIRRKNRGKPQSNPSALDDVNGVDPLAGFTDAMKEVLQNKGQRKGRKNAAPTSEDVADNLEGYNSEMKAIAENLKKTAKKAKKKQLVASPNSIARSRSKRTQRVAPIYCKDSSSDEF